MDSTPLIDPGQILLVDKPIDWTSFDVVNKLRWSWKIKKIGHAGTLDPLATGLLIICTGKATKKIESLTGLNKTYEGTMVLGKTTPSFDLETEVDASFPIDHINREAVESAKNKFLGTQEQVPPLFSAVKVKGKRAYEHARKGQNVKLQPREITIEALEFDTENLPELKFRMTCSKGTYVRSFARDFGLALNSGAYLSALRRTAIGEFYIGDALGIDDTIKRFERNEGP